MPRSRSLVASPRPACFLFLSSSRICRLMPHRASEPFSCAISGTIEPVCLPIVPSRAPSNLFCSSHRRSDLVLAVPIRLVSTDPATSPPITLVSSDRTHRARPRQYRLCHINLVNVIHDHSAAIPIARPYLEQRSMPYHVFPSHRPIPIAFACICCRLRPSLVYHQSPSPSHDPIAYSSLITTPLPACVTLHYPRSSSSPTDYRRSRPPPTQSRDLKYGGGPSSNLTAATNNDPNNKHDN